MQLRRAQESPTARTTGIQRCFLRLASLLHDIVAPMQQSRQLYDIMSWRRGKTFNLRVLLTVANWNPPELASPLLPASRIYSLEDDARQDPGADSPGGTERDRIPRLRMHRWQLLPRETPMVSWSPPHRADLLWTPPKQKKEPAQTCSALHLCRSARSTQNIHSAFAVVQENAADDGGSVKAVQREGRIGPPPRQAGLVWSRAVASAVS